MQDQSSHKEENRQDELSFDQPIKSGSDQPERTNHEQPSSWYRQLATDRKVEFWTAITAGLSTLVMAVFTGLLWWTSTGQWEEMIKSNKNSEAAAKISQESLRVSQESYRISEQALRVSEDTLVASQRAVVYFEPAAFGTELDEKGIRRWWIQIPIGNSGNSPTRDLMYSLACKPSPKVLEEPFDRKILSSQRPQRITLAPKVTIRPMSCTVSTEELRAIRTGHWYVFGHVKYRDGVRSKEIRVTEFCYDLANITFDAVRPNITAMSVPCPSHNCVDEECKSTD